MTPDGHMIVGLERQRRGRPETASTSAATPRPTDTAGPMLTDFLLPDGTQLSATTRFTPAAAGHGADLRRGHADNGRTGSGHESGELPALVERRGRRGGISQVYYGLDEANVLGANTG